MKSSSELFPVSLFRADVIGDLTDDVYLLKHLKDKDDMGVEIALGRVGIYGQSPAGKQPIVLVHGSFTNRGFWLSPAGIGLARYLVENGYDVWIPEMRGHGLSPRNDDYKRNNVERYVTSDLPAINDFIIEKTQLKAIWCGHSLGGVTISTALASGHLPEVSVAGVVLLGTQVVRRRALLQFPLIPQLGKLWFTVKQHEMDGRKLGIGPENEPAGIAKEYLSWLGLLGQWRLKSNKTLLKNKWKGLNLPVLAMVGKNDKSDPAKYCKRFFDLCGSDKKEFKLLSTENGFSKDYGHVDMVVSKDAASEVWPEIHDWLNKIPATNFINR